MLVKIQDVIKAVEFEFFFSNWLEKQFNIPPGASMLFAIAIIGGVIGIIGLIIIFLRRR